MVEADDSVVGLNRPLEELCAGVRCEGTESADGRGEGAVDEQQDPRRSAGWQSNFGQGSHPYPRFRVGGRDLDKTLVDSGFEQLDGRPGDDRRGEPQHEGTDIVDEATVRVSTPEWPGVDFERGRCPPVAERAVAPPRHLPGQQAAPSPGTRCWRKWPTRARHA